VKVPILLATRNRHKVREFRQMLQGAPIRLLDIRQFPHLPLVEEKADSFYANAVRKAVKTSECVPFGVLADDSGLCVRALNGGPGVRSARYARSEVGPKVKGDCLDKANVAKLLKALAGVPPSKRQARYVCVLALAQKGRLLRTFYGSCLGTIAQIPKGSHGFGYDPVFIPKGFRRTMAELSHKTKHRISHRGRALRKMRDWLNRSFSSN